MALVIFFRFCVARILRFTTRGLVTFAMARPQGPPTDRPLGLGRRSGRSRLRRRRGGRRARALALPRVPELGGGLLERLGRLVLELERGAELLADLRVLVRHVREELVLEVADERRRDLVEEALR